MWGHSPPGGENGPRPHRRHPSRKPGISPFSSDWASWEAGAGCSCWWRQVPGAARRAVWDAGCTAQWGLPQASQRGCGVPSCSPAPPPPSLLQSLLQAPRGYSAKPTFGRTHSLPAGLAAPRAWLPARGTRHLSCGPCAWCPVLGTAGRPGRAWGWEAGRAPARLRAGRAQAHVLVKGFSQLW